MWKTVEVSMKKGRKRKTHEKFIEELKATNQNIDIVGTYIDSRTKIQCCCKICGNMWDGIPNELLRGSGCPNCTHSRRKKTHEEFIAQLKNIHPNIEVLSKYLGAKQKIECRCKVCNNKWFTTPDHLLHRTGCVACKVRDNITIKRRPRAPRTHESFVDDMKDINPNIEILGKYFDNKTKIECRCLICGNEWNVLPKSLLQRHGCPNCARKKARYNRRKTQDEFVSQMKVINSNIEIIGKYVNDRNRIRCRCLNCNNEWESRPSSLLSGSRCPNCIKPKGEDKIEKYLQKSNIPYVSQKRFDNLTGVGGKPLSYDFYLHETNILVEFNGEQHDRPINYFGGVEKFKVQQEHDKRKREYAREHDIDLLEIWYYDYDNIEQILNKKLHMNNKKSA